MNYMQIGEGCESKKCKSAGCARTRMRERGSFLPLLNPDWSLNSEPILLDGWTDGLLLVWRHNDLHKERTTYIKNERPTKCQPENESCKEVKVLWKKRWKNSGKSLHNLRITSTHTWLIEGRTKRLIINRFPQFHQSSTWDIHNKKSVYPRGWKNCNSFILRHWKLSQDIYPHFPQRLYIHQ